MSAPSCAGRRDSDGSPMTPERGMGAGPRRLRRALLAHAALLGVAAFAPAAALAALTVTPITWDVVGLDSNNVNVGPNTFPVGVRVCTDSNPATDVQATFVWTSSNPYIALRTGTASVLPVVGGSVDLAAGDCYDFYFEAEVTRNPGAYETTRSYRIDVVADGGATTAASPTPRQLFVERLISQSRNEDLNLLIRPTGVGSYTSVPAGGTFALLVGGVYDIRLLASTATNGYEQLETYINIPNVVFEILSVQSTYTAASGGGSLSEDRLYADSCDWQANPLSPAYRSCTAVGKAGGNIQVDYVVRILAPPGAPLVNPAPISTVVHDFSGSSYHYNADYSGTTRDLYIVDPSILGFGKAFNPSTTTAGGISTLTFTITNPAPAPISGLSFTDTFPTSPGAMVVATPATFSTSGCGTPTFSPTAGAGSVSFSNGTVGANSTCSVSVAVRVPVAGTYDNTSGPLLVQGTDTGSVATASLIATTAPPAPACVNGMVLATWTFNSGTATLPFPGRWRRRRGRRAASP